MRAKKLFSDQSIAIVYDRLNSSGGAEKVLVALLRLYPQADILTSVWSPKDTPWLPENTKVVTSWIQHIPGITTKHRYLGWLMPLIFWCLPTEKYDVVVSVTSEFAKGVRARSNQFHICYLLTPTRYLWSHRLEYRSTLPFFVRSIFDGVTFLLRSLDRYFAQKPHVIIPISESVGTRAKLAYQIIPGAVVYPPVAEISRRTKKPRSAENLPYTFYFTWGRHVPYKKFLISLTAAVKEKVPLVIAGEGPETQTLKKHAKSLDPKGEFIFFVGRISDEEIAWFLEHAQATLFPQEEDFGIVVMESVLAGCPVIVNKDSGAAELLTDHDGIFLPDSSVSSVAHALRDMKPFAWERLDIRRRARQYAGVRFSRDWENVVDDAWNTFQAQTQKKKR